MSEHVVQIVVLGPLSPELIAALDGFQVQDDARGTTRVTGAVPDQSKLFGVLDMFDRLNIEVVSVNRIAATPSAESDGRSIREPRRG